MYHLKKKKKKPFLWLPPSSLSITLWFCSPLQPNLFQGLVLAGSLLSSPYFLLNTTKSRLSSWSQVKVTGDSRLQIQWTSLRPESYSPSIGTHWSLPDSWGLTSGRPCSPWLPPTSAQVVFTLLYQISPVFQTVWEENFHCQQHLPKTLHAGILLFHYSGASQLMMSTKSPWHLTLCWPMKEEPVLTKPTPTYPFTTNPLLKALKTPTFHP